MKNVKYVCLILLLLVFSEMSAVKALKTNKRDILDEDGSKVVLKGVCLTDLDVLCRLRNWNMSDTDSLKIFKMIEFAINIKANVIRVPVLPFSNHLPSELNYGWFDALKGYDKYFDNYLRPLINIAKLKNIYIILDLHYKNTHYNISEKDSTINFWRYIVSKCKNTPNLIYEIYNEPEIGEEEYKNGVKIENADWSKLKTTLMQPVVNDIRAQGDTTIIIVGGPNYCHNMFKAMIDPIVGKNIAYSLHIYPGSIVDTEVNQDLVNKFPVLITEWGYQNIPSSDSWLIDNENINYRNKIKSWLKTNCLSWTAFCFDKYWTPKVFDEDWKLLTGDSFMGEEIQNALIEEYNCPTNVKDPNSFNKNFIINIIQNPDGNKLSIKYSSSITSTVSINIVNCLGYNVTDVISDQFQDESEKIIVCDISNLSQGIYFCSLRTNNILETKKFIVIR